MDAEQNKPSQKLRLDENHKLAPDLPVMKQASGFDKQQQLCSMPGASCSLRAEELLSPHCQSPVRYWHMNVDRCDGAQNGVSVQHHCRRQEQVEERQHFLAASSSALAMGT